jgi:uncharacterized protein YecE (DUF72 family)
VHVGAVGWEHDHWRGSFYPDDLPPEWRLTYYNQWFDTVLVPRTRWERASAEELSGWSWDTLDRFRFVLDVGQQAPTTEELERAAALAPKLGMWYPCPGSTDRGAALVWIEPDGNLKELSQRVRNLADEQPEVYLIARRPDAAYLNRVVTLLELLRL